MEHRNKNKLEGVTQDEVSKLTKAMKDTEFKKYMDEYCKETSDPKNKKEYLQYLDQLEAKGEMPDGQALLRTQPGCCVKTNILFKSGQTQKCFINIVHTDMLADFSMDRAEKGEGHKVKLPYSLSPPRPDRDSKDEYCMTCDLAVSSRTYFQAMQNPNILKMLVDTASENLGTNFLQNFEEVKKDYKVMQRMQCKGGCPMPMSVKAELLKEGGKNLPGPSKEVNAHDAVTPGELKQMRSEIKGKKATEDAEEDRKVRTSYEKKLAEEDKKRAAKKAAIENEAPRIRVPKHQLIHSGTINLTDYMEIEHKAQNQVSNVPKLLRLVVELPTVKKVGDVNLEVTKCNIVVEVDGKYYLDLPLPYEIDDANGTAKFDKVKQTLSLDLPVVPKAPDPDMIAAAKRAMSGIISEEDDGALDENKHESDEELQDLEEPADPTPSKKKPAVPASDQKEDPPPAPPKPPRPSEPLESGAGGALMIPQAAEAAKRADEEPALDEEEIAKRAEEELLAKLAEAQYPDFSPCDQFQGFRQGYAFKLGDNGLGYYRDVRQSLPGQKPAPAKRKEIRFRASDAQDDDAEDSDDPGPLVTEVPASSSTAPAVSSTAAASRSTPAPVSLPPLPAALKRYVDETTRLRQRLPAAECEDGPVEDLPRDSELAWHQTTHNLVLIMDLEAGLEVADVQMIILDRRLTLLYASRPISDGADAKPWRRRRLRKVLYNMVDAQQGHVELSGTTTSTSSRELVLVLRKADQSEPWPEAFDAKGESSAWQEPAAASPATTSASPPVAEVPEGIAEKPDSAAAAASRIADAEPLADAKAANAAVSGKVSVREVVDMADIAEDSSALDATVPAAAVAGPSTDAVDDDMAAAAAAAAAAASAKAAAAAAAAVMGQSVLLRNRLMYQLL